MYCERENNKRQYNSCRVGHDYDKRENNMSSQNNLLRGKFEHCYHCGLKGHWKIECQAPENIVMLYQNSIKRKGNKGGNFISNT